MLLMADRLELERAVGHIEMSAEALAEQVQHLARATLADARVVQMTCADSTGTPLVIVQACRSCTSTTPRTRLM